MRIFYCSFMIIIHFASNYCANAIFVEIEYYIPANVVINIIYNITILLN